MPTFFEKDPQLDLEFQILIILFSRVKRGGEGGGGGGGGGGRERKTLRMKDGYKRQKAGRRGQNSPANHVVNDREMNSLARSLHPHDLLYTGGACAVAYKSAPGSQGTRADKYSCHARRPTAVWIGLPSAVLLPSLTAFTLAVISRFFVGGNDVSGRAFYYANLDVVSSCVNLRSLLRKDLDFCYLRCKTKHDVSVYFRQ